MQQLLRYALRAGAALAATGSLVVALALGSGAALAAPTASGPLQSNICTLSGTTRTCDLYAQVGSITLPGAAAPVPVWGYTSSATGIVNAPGGPTIIANEGEKLVINLHNTLADKTSLTIVGQTMPVDTIGAAAGSVATPTTYTINSLVPGTYEYEAGPTPNGARQVAMGLFGALIVRPAGAPLQAYAGANTAFTDEAALVFSEIDPAFNAAPATFNLNNYSPKYWLINGQAYASSTANAPITVTAGATTLLRLVNAGVMDHSIGLLGLHQKVIATGGKPLSYTYDTVAETIPAGDTLDTLVSIRSTTPAGTQYAIYEAGLAVNNNGGADFGGMLTFLQVSSATTTTSAGPVTSAVSVLPSTPTNGSVSVNLAATITADSVSVSPIVSAEYFIDAIGANGSGTPMTLATPNTTPTGASATILATTIAALPSGTHTIYVHGKDAANVWGTTASTTLVVDKVGPVTSNVTANLSTGAVSASVTDQSTGGGNIQSAEYFIDTVGANGSGVAMSGVPGTSPATVTATIPGSVISGLSGQHTIYVHGRDTLGNWGAVASVSVAVDTTGPSTTVVLTPNLINSGTISVRANGDDTSSGNSNVTAAQYILQPAIATPPTAASVGTDMGPASQAASTASFTVASVSAPTTEGLYSVYARSKDLAGNWGAWASATLTVDKTGPTTDTPAVSPNPNNGTLSANGGPGTQGGNFPSILVTAHVLDSPSSGASSAVVAGEAFIDTVAGTTQHLPAPATFGTGAQMLPIDGVFNTSNENAYVYIPLGQIVNLSSGSHLIYIHGKDAAGNWGTTFATATLVIDRIAPTASSVNRAGTTPTNAASVQFLVTFSEPVTGLTSSNFTVVRSGVTGTPAVTTLTNNNNNTWTMTVSTGSGSGTIGLNLTSAAGVTDLAGNALSLPATITGQTYTIDKTAPTFNVALSASSIPAGTASVNLTVTGAADTGGSGLANAGEYWINPPTTTTPAPGSGTQFTGTTASIPTSTFAVGSYTVSVRIRDNAGNWSTVRTATLTVTGSVVVQAANDTLTITANGNANQTSNVNSPGVLTNDQPIGANGRTVKLTTAPIRTSGNGTGTVVLSCPGSLGTAATPSVGGSTICTNGAYRVTLNGAGATNSARQASKQGTFTFTYTETLNSVTSTATVTITVN